MLNKENIEIMNDEINYINLIRDVLENGERRGDRTGTGTISRFGTQCRYSLKNNQFPLLTTKKMFTRGIIEELLWFIRGSTDAKELQDKNVHIWDGNSNRKFLVDNGFDDYDEGDLGPIYGFQWRHFGAEYVDCKTNYEGNGIDQLKYCVDEIRNNPSSRRIVMCAWNAKDLKKQVVPPCHCMVQFYVNFVDGTPKYLSGQLYQRSADIGLGVPFNIASYSILLVMMAHVCQLEPGEFVHTMGDSHIYLDHVEPLKEQITRQIRNKPKIFIKKERLNLIKELNDYHVDDFIIEGYQPHDRISMKMSS
ncbi:hypothetical protein SNEBB_002766 [Seison nebaliae]|nr:hypothetical protein SNEBB_002766 [Seison nebaliae]